MLGSVDRGRTRYHGWMLPLRLSVLVVVLLAATGGALEPPPSHAARHEPGPQRADTGAETLPRSLLTPSADPSRRVLRPGVTAADLAHRATVAAAEGDEAAAREWAIAALLADYDHSEAHLLLGHVRWHDGWVSRERAIALGAGPTVVALDPPTPPRPGPPPTPAASRADPPAPPEPRGSIGSVTIIPSGSAHGPEDHAEDYHYGHVQIQDRSAEPRPPEPTPADPPVRERYTRGESAWEDDLGPGPRLRTESRFPSGTFDYGSHHHGGHHQRSYPRFRQE
jgi:hypothetical protein